MHDAFSFRVLALLIAVLSLTACTTINKTEAVKLGEQGTKTSQVLFEEAVAARTDFASSNNRVIAKFFLDRVFSKAYPVSEIPQLTTETAESIKRNAQKRLEIVELLSARERTLQQLRTWYSEFGGLAGDEPGTDVKESFSKFAAEGNAYIALASTLAGPAGIGVTAISETITTTLGEGLALVAEERQRREILASSKAIREALESIYVALENEKKYAAGLRQESATTKRALRDSLSKLNVTKKKYPIGDIVALADVEPNKDVEATIEKNERLKKALEGYEKHYVGAETENIEKAYTALLKNFEGLISAHKKLEKGAPIDFDQLLVWAARMQTIVDAIGSAREADKKALSEGA